MYDFRNTKGFMNVAFRDVVRRNVGIHAVQKVAEREDRAVKGFQSQGLAGVNDYVLYVLLKHQNVYTYT